MPRKDHIRSAAFHCFSESGYHETTVQSICEKAAISKGGFYWHYRSKQEVFVDILDTWSREVIDELRAQFQAAVQAEDFATSIAVALARESHRGRALVPLWLDFSLRARQEPLMQAAISRFYRRIRTTIAELLRPALASELTAEELDGISTTIFGAFIGVLFQEICDPEETDAERAFARSMSALDLAITGSRPARRR